MTARVPPFAVLVALWLAALASALAVRPLLPVDETRYLAVAWEMWLRGDSLVPHLNGAPYSHKPPLLFWAVHLGWGLFGVNEWSARLVAPLVGLANLWLIARLARRLWPGESAVAGLAPWIAFGSLLWIALATLTLFDLLVVFCALLGLLGLIEAADGRPACGFVLAGVAIGLGVLAKGPVILLHLLPAALLAPWWARAPRPRWGRWYAGVLGAVLLGAAIALAWAIPAGRAGGPEYHNAIFWGQTAERMAESFAHRHPWWWYLPLLPLLLFPWSLWPPLWRGLARLRAQLADRGVRFCLAWMLPVFAGFSLISGKQPQYLLPPLAAFALLAARALASGAPDARRADPWPVGIAFIAAGVLLALLPELPLRARLPEWIGAVGFIPGLLVALTGAAVVAWRAPDVARAARALTAASAALLAVVHGGVLTHAASAFDLAPIGAQLNRLQADGRPIAHLGKYHGQYQFVGRLQAPLAVVAPEQLARWAADHPGGKAVAYADQLPAGVTDSPEFEQPFRGSRVQLWDAGVLARWLAVNQARE